MITHKTALTAATLLAALSSTAAFGAGDSTNSTAPETQRTETSEKKWGLSTEVFYASALDGYFSDSESEVDLYGTTFLFNRTLSSDDKLAVDLGVLGILDYGTEDYYGLDLTQIDLMAGTQFGLRFMPTEDISFGLGTQFGVDARYGKLEYRSQYRSGSEDDIGFGTFWGIYVNSRVKLSRVCDLSLTARYMKTSVELSDFYDDDFNIGYLMLGIGVNFKF